MRMRVALAISLLSLLLAGAADATAWKQFRYGPAHLGVNPFETKLGVATVLGLHAGCASPVARSSASTSPAVAEGIVVNTSFLEVDAIDERSCALRWSQPLGSISEGSPGVAGGRVIVATHDNGVYAFDLHTGAQLWNNPQPGNADGSPTIVGQTAYFVTVGGSIYALDVATGALRWRRDVATQDGTFNAPTVMGGRIFMGSASGQMRAFRASDGKSLWTRGKLGFGVTEPAASGGVLYFTADQTLYALDAAHGTQIWAVPTGSSERLASLPAVSQGIVWIRTRDRMLRAFDAATGSPRFATAMGGQVPEPGNSADSAPTIANGVVYVTSSDARLYAFNAAGGALLSSVSTIGNAYGPVTVVNGRVWVGTGDIRCSACSFVGSP
jgi:eukaryotic-like serine/threonine-protein kinase